MSDLESSVRWYVEHFGLRVERLNRWRRQESLFVSLRISTTVIIDLIERPFEGENVDHVAFTTSRADFDDFVDTHSDLIEMGPRELSGAQGTGLGIYLRDPDGHRLELRTYD